MSGLGEIFSYGATSVGQNLTFGVWGASIFVSGWSSPQYTINANVNDGVFHHVAVAYDGVNSSVYFDGTLLDTRAFGIYTTDGTANIGARILPRDFFSGIIDEVSIYNRALSPSEIAAIYEAGSAGKCRVPFITSQPQSQLGYWGQNASFSVGALPPPLNYQWQSNGAALSGATNLTLVLTNLQNSFAAAYTVVVSNSYGSVTSSPPANLTINPAGVAIALYPGVYINGVAGLTYGIQSSTNLADTNSWIGLTNLTFTVPTEMWYDSAPASLPQRFYRVLEGPIPIP